MKMKLKWPDRSKISEGAFDIVKKLRKAGFESYIAGGAVRDAVLRRPLKEIDIATAATPNQVEKLFAKTIPTGKVHGTITVLLPLPVRERDGVRGYEVTTFRSEGPYRDHRRPVKVKFIKDPAADASRRDFTINALFYEPQNSMVIDHVSGLADLAHKRIRLVGDSDERIKEDELRMMRAVRFVTVLADFRLSVEARKSIQKHAKLIAKISHERVKAELDKIMMSERPSIGIGLLDVAGLLEYVLPEVKNLQGVDQPANQHAEGDVFAHSLLALEDFDDSYDLVTRYAVLFHDLGKAATRQMRSDKITFYDHQNVGAELAKKICKRLRFSARDTDKIFWLTKNHMVPNDFVNMKLSTRRKWALAEHFSDLLRVYKADAGASLSPSGRADKNPRGYREGLMMQNEIKLNPALKKPIISGNEIMKTLKISPGILVGKILKVMEEKKLANKLRTKTDAVNFLKENKNYLKKL